MVFFKKYKPYFWLSASIITVYLDFIFFTHASIWTWNTLTIRLCLWLICISTLIVGLKKLIKKQTIYNLIVVIVLCIIMITPYLVEKIIIGKPLMKASYHDELYSINLYMYKNEKFKLKEWCAFGGETSIGKYQIINDTIFLLNNDEIRDKGKFFTDFILIRTDTLIAINSKNKTEYSLKINKNGG